MGRDDLSQHDTFASLLGHIPAGAWWAKPDGTRLLYVNPAIEALTGHLSEEFLAGGQTLWLQVVVPEDRPAALAAAHKAVREGTSDVEFRIVRPDGQTRWVCDRKTLVRDGAGQAIGICGFMVDVTEARAAQEAVRQSESKYRALVEITDTGYLILDDQGRVVDANAEYVRLSGYGTLDEIVGRNVVEWTAPDDRERNAAEFARCLRQGSTRDLVIDYVDGQGRITPVEIQATVLAAGPGSVRIVSLCRDITARRRAEQALRDSEELHRLHFENVGDIVSAIDLNMRMTAISPSVERISGYRPDEFVGRRLDEAGFIPPDQLPGAMADIARVLAGETRTGQYEFLTKAGARVPVEITASPLIRDGRIDGVITVTRDISERLRAEEKLRRSEQQSRAIIQALPDVVYRVARSGIYGAMVSDRRGFPLIRPWNEYEGRPIRDKTPADFALKVEQAIEQAFVTGEVQVLEYDVDDPATGEKRFREARYVAAGPDGALCLTRDITDRKRAEEALRTSEVRNRALIKALPDNLVILDRQGVFQEVISDRGNPPVRSREEVLGHSLREFEPAAAADSVVASIEEAIRTQKTVTAEIEVPPPHGEQAGRWREARYVALGPDRVLRLTRDITGRKRAEEALRKSEARNRSFIEAIPDNMVLFTGRGVYKEIISDRGHPMTRSPEELVGRSIRDILAPEMADRVIAGIEEALRTGRTATAEVAVPPPHGGQEAQWRDMRFVATGPDEVLSLTSDITGRRGLEEAARRSQMLLASAANLARLGAVEHDVVSDRLTVTDEWLAIHGFQEREVSVADMFAVIHPDDRKMLAATQAAIVRGDQPYDNVEYRIIRPDNGQVRVVRTHGTLIRDENGQAVRALGVFQDVTEARQAESLLREAVKRAEELARFPAENPSPVLRVRRDGLLIYANAACLDQADWGCRVDHFLPALMRPTFNLAVESGGLRDCEIRTTGPDGDRVYWMTFVPVPGADDVNIYGRDITELKKHEEEIRRLNRTLAALGETNKAMMRAETENGFLESVCRIIVEECGHAMAWIGYAQPDEAHSVRPVAHAGFEQGYLESIQVTWADTPSGRGPTGVCIRTGEPCVIRDIRSDPYFAIWRQDAIRRGYAAVLGLPLIGEKQVVGAITIYARATDPFSPDEVGLLSQLAADVSYGIAAIRMRRAHALAEQETLRSRERLRKVTIELTLAEESERRRLATHLHENLVQLLGLIQIKLSMLDPAADPAARAAGVRELTGLVDRAVAASQSLTHQLGHPALYDLGFVAGAQRLAEDVETLYHTRVVVDDDDQPKPLGEPIRVMLFECLRESLVNACKHARVDVVKVRIRRIGDTVRVLVADGGVGFDPAGITSGRARGFGLFSIRERLHYLGGRVDIRSSPGKGAIVSMTVPVDGAAADSNGIPRSGPKEVADPIRSPAVSAVEPDNPLEGNP